MCMHMLMCDTHRSENIKDVHTPWRVCPVGMGFLVGVSH